MMIVRERHKELGVLKDTGKTQGYLKRDDGRGRGLGWCPHRGPRKVQRECWFWPSKQSEGNRCPFS